MTHEWISSELIEELGPSAVAVEVHGCRLDGTDVQRVHDDDEAEFFTVYLLTPRDDGGRTSVAVADLPNREEASILASKISEEHGAAFEDDEHDGT